MRNDNDGGQYFACVVDRRRADATLHLQDCAWRISLLLSCWGAVWVSKFIYLAPQHKNCRGFQVSLANDNAKRAAIMKQKKLIFLFTAKKAAVC